jgi:hypothetical protein
MPFVGLVCALGLLFALSTTDALGRVLGVSHPAAVIAAAVSFWFGFGALGLVAAVLALVRDEQRWGMTLAGFLLNAPLALGFVLWDGGWASESRDLLMKCVPLACAALVFVGFFWPKRESGAASCETRAGARP